MRAIILARVSTEEQMTEGHSIPAQLAKAREYAIKHRFEIKSEHPFDESSIKDHREKFEKVIKEIIESKESIALIVETVDRLQRSFKESVRLEEFRRSGKLEIHFIRENLVIHKESNSSEIQRWDLAVFMAKGYVLQISDNVKRSIIENLRQGIYPAGAPLGYLNSQKNNSKNKCLIVDTLRAPFIIKAFELYATGSHSIRSVHRWLSENGFRNHRGGNIVRSAVEKILQNPIYYGSFNWKGKLYKGTHPPLISQELFDKVQNKMHRKTYAMIATKKEYPFRSMLTCGRCGCRWTAAIYKHKYVYHHCSFTNYKCGNPYIEQNKLAEIFADQVVKKVFVEHGRLDWLKEALRRRHQGSGINITHQREYLETEIVRLEKNISDAYDDKLAGKISEDFWKKKDAELNQKKISLEKVLQNLGGQKIDYYEKSKRIFELSENIYPLYVKSNLEKKSRIAKIITSNCTVNDVTLYPTYRKPFSAIAEGLLCPEKLPREGSNLGPSGYT